MNNPQDAGSATLVPEDLPVAGDTTSQIDLSKLEHLEDGPDDSEDDPGSLIPCKKNSDFYVEFLENDKRKHIGLDNIGDWVKSIDFGQQDVALAPVKKKKKRPSQEDMPWTAKIVFFDDPANCVADFIDLLKTYADPFRIRVQSINEHGASTEAFVMKSATLTSYPRRFSFNLADTGPRLLTLEFACEAIRRKSTLPKRAE